MLYMEKVAIVEASSTLFEELVSPSQEAFTLLIYKNEYMNWVWIQNESGMSDTSNGGFDGASDGPEYLELTSRNGG
jgi:hypothetical protein